MRSPADISLRRFPRTTEHAAARPPAGHDPHDANLRNLSSHEQYELIRASQHPSACDRLLLVVDDMGGAGLGMTARMLSSLLLIAVRQRRVLTEVTSLAQLPQCHRLLDRFNCLRCACAAGAAPRLSTRPLVRSAALHSWLLLSAMDALRAAEPG